jgi:hypothetical protein
VLAALQQFYSLARTYRAGRLRQNANAGASEGDIAMRTAALSLALLLSTAANAESASKHFCLNASLIAGTGVIDENTIIYRMNNGKVWKNTLRTSCPNLKFAGGFSEVIRSDEICANQQFIAVLGTGNTCQLGDFSPVDTAQPKSN